jgi:hypothetical protein
MLLKNKETLSDIDRVQGFESADWTLFGARRPAWAGVERPVGAHGAGPSRRSEMWKLQRQLAGRSEFNRRREQALECGGSPRLL